MFGIRQRRWLAAFCVCVGLMLCLHHRTTQRRMSSPKTPTTPQHQTFSRVPPTQRSPQTLSNLLGELSDPSPVVRERAATDLGVLGPEAFDALPDLKRLAHDDPDEDVRRASRTAVFNVRGGHQSQFQLISGPEY